MQTILFRPLAVRRQTPAAALAKLNNVNFCGKARQTETRRSAPANAGKRRLAAANATPTNTARQTISQGKDRSACHAVRTRVSTKHESLYPAIDRIRIPPLRDRKTPRPAIQSAGRYAVPPRKLQPDYLRFQMTSDHISCFLNSLISVFSSITTTSMPHMLPRSIICCAVTTDETTVWCAPPA